MIIFKKYLDNLHQFLAKSKIIVAIALKVRNQCNAVIKYYLGENTDHNKNGEFALIRCIAPTASYFVDVGANVGNWSLFFASAMRKECKGICFEPSQFANVILRQSLANFQNIHIVDSAVGSFDGEISLYEGKDANPHSSVVELPRELGKHLMRKVGIVRLDTCLNSLGIDFVDFVKIDAEGYDFEVIKGLEKYLVTQKVGVVQFEYGGLWAKAGSTLAFALKYLNSFNYTCYLLKSSGLHQICYERYGDYYSFSNYIAVSKAYRHKLDNILA